MPADLIPLGKTDIQITPLGIGTWQWGDRVMWGYGKTYTDADVQAAFQTSLDHGLNWFDTAEVYGLGISERLLGQYVRAVKGETAAAPAPLVATKFFPFPWRLTKAQFRRTLKGSLNRLGMKCVDLYQIHWPFPPVSIETWAEALADAVSDGLIRSAGVSNYNLEQMLRADIALGKRGVPLASNQVPYSLLDRRVERSGLLSQCVQRGITLIAYSPLAQGMLSGKYTPEKPPSGIRARRYNPAYLAKIQPLVQLLRQIGQEYGKTPSQVALNWVVCKSAVPIPGARNARHAEENAAAIGWRLTAEQVAALDRASDQL